MRDKLHHDACFGFNNFMAALAYPTSSYKILELSGIFVLPKSVLGDYRTTILRNILSILGPDKFYPS